MQRFWDNPVLRHAGRLGARGARPWVIFLLLAGSALLGALLQKYWMELELYTLLRPERLVRWLALTLLAETVVALPWAAVRGSLLWRRLAGEGHLEEYRRSRLSPFSIALGAILASLSPVLVLLAVSMGVSLIAGITAGELTFPSVATVHGILGAQAFAFAVLGLWLAGRLRYPAAAIPTALVLLAFAVCAIALIDPFLRRLNEPTAWIYWALLPNPVTAVGVALNTDVLRFSWIYQKLHAHEYFFMYPPVWQTVALYLGAGGVLLLRLVRRIARWESP